MGVHRQALEQVGLVVRRLVQLGPLRMQVRLVAMALVADRAVVAVEQQGQPQQVVLEQQGQQAMVVGVAVLTMVHQAMPLGQLAEQERMEEVLAVRAILDMATVQMEALAAESGTLHMVQVAAVAVLVAMALLEKAVVMVLFMVLAAVEGQTIQVVQTLTQQESANKVLSFLPIPPFPIPL